VSLKMDTSLTLPICIKPHLTKHSITDSGGKQAFLTFFHGLDCKVTFTAVSVKRCMDDTGACGLSLLRVIDIRPPGAEVLLQATSLYGVADDIQVGQLPSPLPEGRQLFAEARNL